MEVSLYIHPLFKIATSRSNGLQMKDIVKLCVLDVSWSTGVFAMELHCEFWCGDFGGGLPGIVFTAVSSHEKSSLLPSIPNKMSNPIRNFGSRGTTMVSHIHSAREQTMN